jgi:hypothetical protein
VLLPISLEPERIERMRVAKGDRLWVFAPPDNASELAAGGAFVSSSLLEARWRVVAMKCRGLSADGLRVLYRPTDVRLDGFPGIEPMLPSGAAVFREVYCVCHTHGSFLLVCLST